jgi:hypothetical protein
VGKNKIAENFVASKPMFSVSARRPKRSRPRESDSSPTTWFTGKGKFHAVPAENPARFATNFAKFLCSKPHFA